MKYIFVTGDKGGVGKSILARLLADFFISLEIPISMYDCDTRNAHLYRFYNSESNLVERINLSMSDEADAFIDKLIDLNQPVLVDLPAGGNGLVETIEKEVGFFDSFVDAGIEVTLVSVMSRSKDSINSLNLLHKLADGRANFVAVKNGYFGEPKTFERFDNSKTRGRLLEGGGKIIWTPGLADSVIDSIDAKNLSFYQCVSTDSSLTNSARRRVKKFLEAGFEAFESVRDFLGIDNVEVAA